MGAGPSGADLERAMSSDCGAEDVLTDSVGVGDASVLSACLFAKRRSMTASVGNELVEAARNIRPGGGGSIGPSA